MRPTARAALASRLRVVRGYRPGYVCVSSAFNSKADSPDVGRHLAFDPDVWSGRALQEGFVELAVSGLASMYPAFDWSSMGSWPSWISARVRSH
jgi:hypothetical protein